MPSFAYKALDGTGLEVSGRLEAADRPAAVRELALRGVSVTEVAQADGHRLPFGSSEGGEWRITIRSKRLAILTRQLAVSLEAGLPLMSALEVMGQELDHAPSCELLKQLRKQVQEGKSFSEALAGYPRVFPPMYVRLVKVGETGGVLDQILGQLADMLERQNELRERVKTASVYPSIVLLLGIVSVVVIVTVIVPRIIESIGAETALLPLPTQVLLGASHVFAAYWWLLIGVTAGVVIGWRQWVLRGPGRPAWDAFKLRVPILGRLIRQLEASRFARSLSILAHGGVTITEALTVVRDTIQNVVMRKAVHDLSESIKSGDSITRPLQRCGLFPPLLVQMVRVGENTGRLDEMLLRAANVHESEARVALDRFVSVLPVLMIVVLAAIIGFIVAGLVMAIVEFQTTGLGAMAR